MVKSATLAEITANAGNLSIPMYVKRVAAAASLDSKGQPASLQSSWAQWQSEGRSFWLQMDAILETLDSLVAKNDEHV